MSGCFWPARGFRSPPGRGRRLVFCALRNYTAGGDAGIGHFDRKQKEKALALLAALLLFFALRNTVPALEPAAGFLRAYLLAGILSAWYISLLRRLLRGALRRYLLGIAGLLLFWQAVRSSKYMLFASHSTAGRYCWYLYYLPFLLIPLVSLYAVLCLNRPQDYKLPLPVYGLAVIPLTLLGFVLSNDLHELVFQLPRGKQLYDVQYRYGPLYWPAVVWIGAAELTALLLLLKKNGRPHGRPWRWMPLFAFCCGAGYCLAYLLAPRTANRLGTLPDMLSLVGVWIWESCILSGLIPSNTHYGELFSASPLGAQIVDREYAVCYAGEKAMPLARSSMILAAGGPVKLDHNTRLCASPIRGGYILWQEDISAIRGLLDALTAAGNRLAEENTLIQAQTELKSHKALLDEQNYLYDRITREVAPQLESLRGLLKDVGTEEAGQRAVMARVCVLSAYIKRRSNLILLGENTPLLPAEELANCLRESLLCLKTAGVAGALETAPSLQGLLLPAPLAALAYDFFEAETEQLYPSLRKLQVMLTGDAALCLQVRAMAPGAALPPPWQAERLENAGASLRQSRENDAILLCLTLPEGRLRP